MNTTQTSFETFAWRITASHMITYFLAGIFAANLMNYQEVFNGSDTLRPYDSPWIAAGPVLQCIRGLIFAAALWYVRDGFINKRFGWLKLWGLVAGLCIFSTCAAAIGSIEGFIYTTTPVIDQVRGYFELLPQTLGFSLMIYFWYQRPGKIWNIITGIMVGLIVLMSTMGFLAGMGVIQMT